jgi:hypothetical protein
MLSTSTIFTSILAASLVQAGPVPAYNKRLFGAALDSLDALQMFDGLAYPDPSGSGQFITSVQNVVTTLSFDVAPLISAASTLLDTLGIDVGNEAAVLADRVSLFGGIGVSGKEVDATLNGSGCDNSTPLALSATDSAPALGQMLSTASLGGCDGSGPISASVSIGGRNFNSTIFPSNNSGFGVISDIDDTVKVTGVLDTATFLKNTFLVETPSPVAGMPAVFAALAQNLNNPLFTYVSGSPSQLFPFLQEFIADNYPRGPILLQNVTLTSLSEIETFTNSANIQPYKTAMIERVQGFYPNKKFLTVGDSTQFDPETYGAAFNKFGANVIPCIWIRKVDGANNTDERFNAAFAGVPSSNFRLYTDDEIPSLANIDVAGGNC